MTQLSDESRRILDRCLEIKIMGVGFPSPYVSVIQSLLELVDAQAETLRFVSASVPNAFELRMIKEEIIEQTEVLKGLAK